MTLLPTVEKFRANLISKTATSVEEAYSPSIVEPRNI